MGAVKTQNLFQCAASINGVTQLEGIIHDSKKFLGGALVLDTITNGDTPRSQLIETSPAEQAHKIKVPVLLIQYEDDRVVPKAQAHTMLKALKKPKKNSPIGNFQKAAIACLVNKPALKL